MQFFFVLIFCSPVICRLQEAVIVLCALTVRNKDGGWAYFLVAGGIHEQHLRGR